MQDAPSGIESLSAEQKRDLLKKLLAQQAGGGRVDLRAEAVFDEPIAGGPAPDLHAAPRTILLTGGTGFVGAFLVRLLLDRTEARLVCLARADDDAQALERVLSNLEKYELARSGDAARLRVVAGDLTRARMGLSEKLWDALADEVDVVYHIAAVVNLAWKYALLKPSNVDGARNILRFAGARRRKPLHYLSSYAIFDSIYNIDRTFSEADEPLRCEGLSNGYCESKWVAETMVRQARARGLPATVYRVGWVVGHSRTGVWNKSDFIPRLIRSCAEVGLACHLGSMTMTPVDFLTEALFALSTRAEHVGGTYHLSNGERYSSDQLFDWASEFGYAIRRVPYAEWEAAMKSSAHEVAIAPMLLFLEQVAGTEVRLSDWFAGEPRVDAARTLGILESYGVHVPRLGPDLMRIYLQHFIASGYLAPPA